MALMGNPSPVTCEVTWTMQSVLTIALQRLLLGHVNNAKASSTHVVQPLSGTRIHHLANILSCAHFYNFLVTNQNTHVVCFIVLSAHTSFIVNINLSFLPTSCEFYL